KALHFSVPSCRTFPKPGIEKPRAERFLLTCPVRCHSLPQSILITLAVGRKIIGAGVARRQINASGKTGAEVAALSRRRGKSGQSTRVDALPEVTFQEFGLLVGKLGQIALRPLRLLEYGLLRRRKRRGRGVLRDRDHSTIRAHNPGCAALLVIQTAPRGNLIDHVHGLLRSACLDIELALRFCRLV